MRTTAIENQNETNFFSAFEIQTRIIVALMIRDAMTRFGHENLGFFWIMGEPLLLSIGVMIAWSLSGGTHTAQVGIIPFVLTGYSLLTLWRHIVFRSVHAMRQNIGLLFHRNIRLLDILLARAALEILGGMAAFAIAYVPLVLMSVLQPIHDPLILICAWFLSGWFCFSFGLLIAGVTEISEPTERFVAPIMYITLPLTGAFYLVHWLPTGAQALVIWSPLVHLFEMFRDGMFGDKAPTEWSVPYILSWCIAMTAAGVPLVNFAQRHVRME